MIALQDTDSSIADVLLGYVSNVEVVTDLEVTLSFVREMCQFARQVVDHNSKIKDSQTNNLPAANENLDIPNLQSHPSSWNQDLEFNVSATLYSHLHRSQRLKPLFQTLPRLLAATDKHGYRTTTFSVYLGMTLSKCGTLYSPLLIQMIIHSSILCKIVLGRAEHILCIRSGFLET